MKSELTQENLTYMVQLLYEEIPILDGDLLLSELEKRCGKVERLGDKEDIYMYSFSEYVVEYKDGKKAPAQIFLAFPDKGKEMQEFDEQSFQQSWSWEDARDVVGTCNTALILTELMAQGLDYKTRTILFHNALESVLSLIPCKAIHWSVCQQFVNPVSYLEAKRSEHFHPLQFGLNVRFFNISNTSGEMLMDSLGLGILGLPDIQCHYSGLDPNQIGQLIYNMAYYIFDNGDIIQDEETVPGINPDDKWKCMHEVALLEPKREVLDINPGQPFAAGNRK